MKTLYIGGLVFDGIGNLLEDHGVLVDGERISGNNQQDRKSTRLNSSH